MNKPRKLLLVNLAWAVALVATAGALYVGAYGAFYWCLGRDVIAQGGTGDAICTAVFTLETYTGPGSELLGQSTFWCGVRGGEEAMSWSEVEREIREIEEANLRMEETRRLQAQKEETARLRGAKATESDIANSAIFGGLGDFKPSLKP